MSGKSLGIVFGAGALLFLLIGAFALFIVISRIQFGADWAATWRRAGFDPFAIAFLYAAAWVAALGLHDLYRLRSRWSIRSDIQDVVRADILRSRVAAGEKP